MSNTNRNILLDEDARADVGRAADDLMREISRQIRNGTLREGEPLPPEREYVEQYGVSRTVVREAVRSLANKGLVDARPRYRPVVRRPSFETAFETVNDLVERLLADQAGVKNLFETRTMLEASLVRHAALHADKDDVYRLREALEDNRNAVDDSELFYQTDKAFHAVLFQIPRNPILPAIQRAYMAWLEPHWSQMPRLRKRNLRNYKSHSEIFEAILMRDPDLAEQHLRTHLANAWLQVRRTFKDT